MTAVWRDAVQVILLLYDGDPKCSPPTEHIGVDNSKGVLDPIRS